MISIHAFRGEGDEKAESKRKQEKIFQSTPSVGKATQELGITPNYIRISIHAFRGEGDADVGEKYVMVYLISIHAFRGEGDL